MELTFTVDKDNTFDAIEAALAIARRGGCRLHALHMRNRANDDAVLLELGADDPDQLDLFLARLHNVIGLSAIAVNTAQRQAR